MTYSNRFPKFLFMYTVVVSLWAVHGSASATPPHRSTKYRGLAGHVHCNSLATLQLPSYPAAMSMAHNSGLKGTSRFTNTCKPRKVVLRQKEKTTRQRHLSYPNSPLASLIHLERSAFFQSFLKTYGTKNKQAY